MQLTEQHVISKDDPRFAVIDGAAFASKTIMSVLSTPPSMKKG